MPSMYSFGFVAALAGLTRALPTPSTPTIEDLTSTGTSSLPEVPEIPTSLPSGFDLPDLPDLESSFMGLGYSNDFDLGNIKDGDLPSFSSDGLLGSVQELDSDSDSDDDEDEDKSDSDSDSGFELPDLDSSFMGVGFSNDFDLGNIKDGDLPSGGLDFLLGSVQTADNDDEESDDEEASK
ncbi:hypothetical protein BJY04DRAFT_77366 [Aspergillus karnatakaensis]|uniref:uncharacterized protein n=1 Tax=Aspergillus karnatakaensis TaxID=1810916 RepID=UPI003CCDE1CB